MKVRGQEMSIGSFLQTSENLELVKQKSWKFGRPLIIEAGLRYYDQHPRDVKRIATNLAYMGLPNSGSDLDEVLRQMAIHYYEKLFVLVKGYECYWIAKHRIEMGDSLEPFHEARECGKAVFIGQSHLGATYLMGSALMANGIDINMVGNFPEPVGSMLERNIKTISEKYHTGQARLLNLADPSVDVPMEMINCLLSRQVVSNVFDENNSFCRPVSLLGREIMGGTGMDLILKSFTDHNVIVVTPFLIRTSEDTFRYELDRHYLAGGDIIASFFDSLERRIKEHFTQWYFIHELHHNFIDQAKVRT